LGRLMELVKSLSAKIERFKFEESVEGFPFLEVGVLGISTEDDDEDCIALEALHSSLYVPVVSIFDYYSDEEQQSPTSQFADLGRSQPVYDSCELDFELDMKYFQEHTAEPYPLFIK
jgi:hypothetical protein